MIKKGFSHIGIFFLSILSLLPLPVLYFFARLLYYPLYYIIGYRKAVVRGNLVKSFPEKNREEIINIEKTFYKYLADLIFEIVKMGSISKKELRKRVKFHNLEAIETYFKKGESVLACTGHYCNWELSMLALGDAASATEYVIYKPINNEVFENWFNKIRTRFGNVFVAMRQTLRAIIATKDTPTMFCFASDQTPVKHETQYVLEFLNQRTAVLLGLEKIALQTNRPIFYFEVKRVKRGYYEVEVMPLCLNPKETQGHEITDLLFEFLEKTIKHEPAFWLWSHRRWKYS
ncbi:lysophospholipid acyltransferase family protein [Pedobacter boryungensis]|uniref:Lysophospholipid acyltransferase family protein n=1 Tax=Pedobacter boryungensis TaxID=869962 RepID=A0ABX2DCE7_9SPHI|nr:lysophospholipid acyltransferase family protein [Pedobacter boryungensis]NQX30829.1 lysophospholipid acyltransferase family protein [Pedobacter boryungensis]